MASYLTTLFFLYSLLAAPKAYALSCMNIDFDLNNWEGSVFRAETKSMFMDELKLGTQENNNHLTVIITECIKGPCETGRAFIKRNPAWVYNPIPHPDYGTINTWAVHQIKDNHYKIPLCQNALQNGIDMK